MEIPNVSDRIRRTTIRASVMWGYTKFGRAGNVAATWAGTFRWLRSEVRQVSTLTRKEKAQRAGVLFAQNRAPVSRLEWV